VNTSISAFETLLSPFPAEWKSFLWYPFLLNLAPPPIASVFPAIRVYTSFPFVQLKVTQAASLYPLSHLSLFSCHGAPSLAGFAGVLFFLLPSLFKNWAGCWFDPCFFSRSIFFEYDYEGTWKGLLHEDLIPLVLHSGGGPNP